MNVADIMTRSVVSVDVNDTLQRIHAIFEESKFHHVIVTDEGRIVGVVSDRDLLKNLSLPVQNPLHETRARVARRESRWGCQKSFGFRGLHAETEAKDVGCAAGRSPAGPPDLVIENVSVCYPERDLVRWEKLWAVLVNRSRVRRLREAVCKNAVQPHSRGGVAILPPWPASFTPSST
jgi:CBS domain-containing protein